jgi:hypothetical protein
MVTWGDIRQWNPALLSIMSSDLNTKYLQLIACSDDLAASGMPTGWTGDAAFAAAGASQNLIKAGEEWAAEIAAIRRASADASDAATGVMHGFHEAEGLANAHGFTIGDDGSIADHGASPDTPPDQLQDVERERSFVSAELTERVKQTLFAAEDIDNGFCAVLDPAVAGHTFAAQGDTTLAAAGDAGTVLGSLDVPTPPPIGASPADNAGWWDSLSLQEQNRMVAEHPEMVGNRDGVAAWARSKANIAMIPRDRQELLDQRTQLMQSIPNDPTKPVPQEIQDQINKINDKLAALDKIDGMMIGADGKPLPNRQLLSLDMGGDKAKAAVASGDVDTAQNVSVFTPGMNSSVEKNLDSYVNDMQGVRETAGKMLGDPTLNSVATVTWLGYEPPTTDSLGSALGAVTGTSSELGASKLTSFDQGINVSREVQPHMTALGHSFGSLTTGVSLHANTGVDDAVFFGSPGISDRPNWLPSTTPEINQLQIPAGHAYTLKADGDPVGNLVPITGRYGSNPDAMPGMNQLSTSNAVSSTGMPLAGSTGHSQYTMTMPDGTDSTSKYNLAAIVSGNPQLAIRK